MSRTREIELGSAAVPVIADQVEMAGGGEEGGLGARTSQSEGTLWGMDGRGLSGTGRTWARRPMSVGTGHAVDPRAELR